MSNRNYRFLSASGSRRSERASRVTRSGGGPAAVASIRLYRSGDRTGGAAADFPAARNSPAARNTGRARRRQESPGSPGPRGAWSDRERARRDHAVCPSQPPAVGEHGSRSAASSDARRPVDRLRGRAAAQLVRHQRRRLDRVARSLVGLPDRGREPGQEGGARCQAPRRHHPQRAVRSGRESPGVRRDLRPARLPSPADRRRADPLPRPLQQGPRPDRQRRRVRRRRRAGAERRFLQSPHFLYRTETSATVVAGKIPLNDYEIASRLSYGLLNTMPDDALLAAAGAKRLQNRDGSDRSRPSACSTRPAAQADHRRLPRPAAAHAGVRGGQEGHQADPAVPGRRGRGPQAGVAVLHQGRHRPGPRLQRAADRPLHLRQQPGRADVRPERHDPGRPVGRIPSFASSSTRSSGRAS